MGILVASDSGVLAVAWLRPLETSAIPQVDAGLKRALVSFATARTVNAIISLAQGITVSAAPLGIGGSVNPGQLLRPVNELVGQFAEFMLIASVAFGVMKILLGIGSYWLVSLFLSVAALGWAWFQWRGQSAPVLLAKVLFVLLLVRFAVPLVTVGSNALFEKFMVTDYSASQNAIDVTSAELKTLDPSAGNTGGVAGTIERLKALPEKLGNLASQLTENIVKIIVMFLLQTLIVPLLLFWALYRAGSILFDLPRLKH